jgi:hypothetical protein
MLPQVPPGGRVATREWRPSPTAPAASPPAWQVIIRDDSGPDTSAITQRVSIGVSVLAGAKDNPDPANELARFVKAILRDAASTDPGNPIAAVLGSLGPYPVPESSEHARRYMTFDYSVVGTPL